MMYGSIRLVTTPWATTGTSPALGPGGGELYEAVMSRTFGGSWRGKSKITSLCFVKYIIYRAIAKMAADSVAVERSL